MAIVAVIAGTSGTFGAFAPSIGSMNGTYTVYSTWNSASQYSNGITCSDIGSCNDRSCSSVYRIWCGNSISCNKKTGI